MAEKKFLDYSGVETLWRKIRERYDKKLDSVTNKDSSVKVNNNREIAVNVSSAEGNQLKVENGLLVPALHKLTFGSDKQYIYDGTEDITVPVYDGKIEE